MWSGKFLNIIWQVTSLAGTQVHIKNETVDGKDASTNILVLKENTLDGIQTYKVALKVIPQGKTNC